MIVFGPDVLPGGGNKVMLPLLQLTIVAGRAPNRTWPLGGTCAPLCGWPKFDPKIVIGSPHEPLMGVKPVAFGAAWGVGVAVGPGVLVGCGVMVGVGLAPNDGKVLK